MRENKTMKEALLHSLKGITGSFNEEIKNSAVLRLTNLD
ncbi:hypothetical protein Desmer_1361 [Desulfosporosinus meridiei DSM 13257]|uniref:Uncharacterized protein n=1 Tax=Desulfosporosinus meridiei (strain ATCC BAA-275 / DSM 13257 / KCTC 12902 / NCIMB 13706 / S10) TaxID=768704 RepID=J7IP47_DESMD|nr:hypothetical protein Desmer_1361 [Desulfosporosinus meridiei DSM 13257]